MKNDEINEAIRILKAVCDEHYNCDECPMNRNCLCDPAVWDEVKDNDVR